MSRRPKHDSIYSKLNNLFFQEQFVGIVGKVGSGKSSIFSAILAEMLHVSGYIHVENLDSIAMVTQEPWIQYATIRDNILFGKPFDHQKYEAVIDAVALQDDLKVGHYHGYILIVSSVDIKLKDDLILSSVYVY